MDELLERAAKAIGMPPMLAERSAQARAEKEGTTVEAVLREWAGEHAPGGETATEGEPSTQGAESPPAAQGPPDPGEEPTEAAEAAPPGEGPTEVSTDYLVELAAEAKRMPPKLVRSSAEARARNSKTDVDLVLATWAGVDLDDLRAKAEAGERLPAVELEPELTGDVPKAEPEPAPAAEAAPEPAAEAAPAAPAASMSVDELLDKAAEAKGMPAALAKRSAQARATKEGLTLEAVLAEWAGVDLDTPAPAPEPAEEAAPAPPAQAPAAQAPAAAAAAMSVDELLEKAAEAKGMPAALAKRSAQARATKEGLTLEAVLAEWAGVDPSAVAPAGESAPAAPAAPAPAAPAEATEESAAGGDVEVIEPEAAPRDEDAVDAEEVLTGSAGGYPAWLAAAFVIIPLLAVTYILVSPNGPDCGTAGQLAVDPVTGVAVNCDGSEYGGASTDFFAQGAGVYAQCAACHGENGGGGVGPAFTGGAVLATFPSGQCTDHIVWVELGTAGFPDPTYGATDKPVGGGGVMPAFGQLTPEQLAAVVLYERVQFGGQDLEEAQVDCGLVEGEGGTEGTDEDMVEASP